MDTTTTMAWEGTADRSFEHCTITRSTGKIAVQSKLEGAINNVHTIIEYELELDTTWTVCSVDIKMTTPESDLSLQLIHNKHGEWTDGALHILPHMEGCIDIDISVTPFTNSLPVKRLCFKTGETRVLKMLYIDLPDGNIKAQQQHYTYLGNNRFVFEVPDTGYKNEITFTPEGFVQHYPGLFELVSAQKSKIP